MAFTEFYYSHLFRYAGYFYDEESKLYYVKARYYDPKTGRFLTRDLVPYDNLYAYVGNNPIKFIDPTGLSHQVEGYGSDSSKYVYKPAPKVSGSYAMAKVSMPAPNQPSIVQSSQQKRLDRNNDSIMKTSVKEIYKTWTRVPENMDNYHEHSSPYNDKFIAPGGHYEIIINTKTNLVVTDMRDIGTYNYFDPVNGKWYDLRNAPHFVFDMVPYYVSGNGPGDTVQFLQRF